MKKLKFVFFFLLLTAYTTVNAQVTYEPDSVFVYKTTKETELKMNVFKPKNHTSADKRPVIVFFFGGGWTSGKPKQFYHQARIFADQGYLAISAEYRVYGRNKTSPFECVADGKSAIRWVRKHACKLGIDPDKVIASGGSAGGHVAACTGVIPNFDEPDEKLKISSVPNAMILFNPVIDTTEKGYGIEKVGKNRKTDISPCHHVVAGIPPTIIFHGTADKTVPYENVVRFTSLMNEAGNTCELLSFENKGHGFFNSTYFRKKSKQEDFDQIMKKSLEFLEKLKINKTPKTL